jgi:hypothetical protein
MEDEKQVWKWRVVIWESRKDVKSSDGSHAVAAIIIMRGAIT